MLVQSAAHGGLRRLPHLRTVLAVYRAGSFGRAAVVLGVSQPTVTNHVKALEDYFGLVLFERNADGVTPTAAAHSIISQVAAPFDQLDRVMAGVYEQDGTHPVRLGGPREFMSARVIPALAALDGARPRIDVTLGEASALLDRLESGSLDVVVSGVRSGRAGLRSWPVADEELILVAAPCLSVPKGVPAALDAVPVIECDSAMTATRRYWNTVFGADPRCRPTLTVPDQRAARSAVLSGLGMAVLPDYLVGEDLADGALIALVDPTEAPLNTLFMTIGEAAIQNRSGAAVLAEAVTELIKRGPAVPTGGRAPGR
ncbi:LysR family transcriptional regulator [Gordonia aichiensis]|uniref:LysR family transcriptional regulator n=1 Tax=Gordonia aichiensis TaxID=36820 RepID=UPI003262DCE3